MNYELAKVLDGSQWLMEARHFRAMLKRAESATAMDIQAAKAAYGQRQTTARMVADVAVIECCGPVTYRSSWLQMYFGGLSIEDMQQQLRAALADPAVKTIVFRWDSPGGSVEMVQEFADELFAARGQKPILSSADTMICSAALWLAAQTDAIYVSTSSRVGAVGTYCAHEDISGMLEKAGIKVTLIAHGDKKVDGSPYEPLSDSARADFQAYVDEIGDLFDNSMARGRGVKKSVVLESFGQGLVFSGKKAIAIGLADKTATFGQLMGRLTKGRAPAAVAARADHTDTGRNSGGKFAAQCDCDPACACADGSNLCGAKCMTCQPDCQCLVAAAAAADPATVEARKTGMGSRQNGGCQACGEQCPCDLDECPDTCDTCDETCACRAAAKAKAAAAADELAALL
jgi:signal peptide peptidase SppA